MAESENDVDQGPPGVQTQVRADQYDMRDDYEATIHWYTRVIH